MRYQPEYDFLCNILHKMVNGQPVSRLTEGLNWDVLLKLADYHELTPLFWRQLVLVRDKLPDGVKTELESRYYQAVYVQLIYMQEVERLIRCLADAGVQIVLLKGIRWAEEIYHEPGLRTFADVDILIKAEELKTTRRLLEGMGYKPETKADESLFFKHHFHCHYFLPQPGLYLELHWGLSHPCRVKPDMDLVWSRVRRIKYGQQQVLALSPVDDLLHLAMHVGSHAFRSRLSWFLDFALLFRKYHLTFKDYHLRQTAEAFGCRRALAYCVLMAGNLCDREILNGSLADLACWREHLLCRYARRRTFFSQKSKTGLLFKYILIDRLWLVLAFTMSRVRAHIAGLIWGLTVL
jgi:hypothetical protein